MLCYCGIPVFHQTLMCARVLVVTAEHSICSEGFRHWLAFQEEGRKLLEYLSSQLNLRSEGFTFSHCSWLLAWLFRTKGGSQWSTCHCSSARPVYAARVLVTVYGCLLGFAKRKGGSCLSTCRHSWTCAVTVSVLLRGWRNEWTAAGDVDKIKQI